MRLIYTTQDQRQAIQLSEFLKREGIENQCEIQTNRDWGSPLYGDVHCTLWVVDEDQMEMAQRWVQEYETNPTNPIFQPKQAKPSLFEAPAATMTTNNSAKVPLNRAVGPVTLSLILSCALLFVFGEMTAPPQKEVHTSLPETPLYLPEFYKTLWYDYPQAYSIIDGLVKAYGIEKLQNLDELPAEGKILLKQYNATPYWKGIYDQLVVHAGHPDNPWDFSSPLFEKIRQGEIWRGVSPILLHANIFHLVFNMLWMIVLGKLIEERVGILRYLIFIGIVATLSNTAQYLMSGPNFLGISGVIIGMLGFIWSRQRISPWEGYRLTPAIFLFMLSFVLGIAFVQFIAFLQEAFWQGSTFPAIASTAHIVGGLVGWAIGRLNFFRMQPSL